ncbi:NUDIX domain-containing protein [Alicyclobacillus fastidiosus]|uniref:NUDIX hydrolase n=1 Tax=Alicyclobacillus fastidiosus TaxID=392011 RepID=A0ABV5AB99_9BACL|nr:NUDIX hydrolase [Alicyclobacillus fastidiosus]WEH10544.1 NUDIX hydrolase [Alicyclobacillus fastidiosus]
MEKRSNWTITHSEVKYRNPWIQVIEHQVIRPDGHAGIYGVLDAGNNAGTVAIDENLDVVLLDEFIFPLNSVTPQIPSGQFREEAPLDAAKRELLEETGIMAATWAQLGTFYMSGGISTQEGHLFLAMDLSYGKSQLEGTEQLSMRKIPLQDAVEMCLSAEIKDSVSVIGILRAAEHLRRKGLFR